MSVRIQMSNGKAWDPESLPTPLWVVTWINPVVSPLPITDVVEAKDAHEAISIVKVADPDFEGTESFEVKPAHTFYSIFRR